MFGNSISTGLTLGKVISGISKTLSVANQIIPLYKEAKPMINNAKTILSVFKEFNKPQNNSKTTIKKEVNSKTSSNTITNQVTSIPKVNAPRFFL